MRAAGVPVTPGSDGPVASVEEALTAGNRELLGKTMPAKGLTLLSVDYGFPLFRR